VLICLICYLTFQALRYLVTSLAASAAPAQITELPKRLDRSMLATEREAWRAMEATQHARSPLAHYHRLDSWIAPDRFNGCTQSGCHAPLPHAKRKEVRAFLNMHATSIQCGICHMKCDDRPLPLIWYDLADGAAQRPPAVLEAYGIVTKSDAPQDAAAETTQQRLVSLLKSAAKDAGNLASLEQLADHFAATRFNSETYSKLWTSARETLPQHFRGEYGAKLALRDPKTGRPILGHPGTQAAVRALLERGKTVDSAERDRMLSAVHPLKRDKALHCTDCHTQDHSLVDFSHLGYPPARVAALTDPVVFRLIEHINSGRPMHLPEVVRPRAANP
jgi:hypothetical protein